MLLSKDAISDVLEVIRPHDHYRPAHQLVHEVILDLYGRGEPADAVTVAAELTKRGDIGRMGGAPYLHTLIASVPTAANAGYYARIVRERAILRRLVEVGTRIVQLGYSGDGDADDLLDRAEAEVYGVAERRVSEDYLPLSEIMPGALDEIEAIGSRGGGLTGVPTGFAGLDALTNGLHPGQMIVIAARPALGKALALDTPLPTPDGWTTMGEVQAGDYLIGADGQALVLAVTGVMHERPCFEVEFSDGAVIVADAEHQWRTTTRASRRQRSAQHAARPGPEESGQRLPEAGPTALLDRPGSVATTAAQQEIVTTAQLAATVRCPVDGRPNHAVPLARPAVLPARSLPFPPYALGAWLAGQASRTAQFATADPDHGTAQAVLRRLGVLGSKHIPAEYLRASEAQRRALLAGLLDTAGQLDQAGTVQLAVTSRRLAADITELVLSLGYRATMTTRSSRGRTAATCHLVTFRAADEVFRLARKPARPTTPAGPAGPAARGRFITGVRPVPSVPVRCVQVDNRDQMYLAGRSWIPTHNSTLALDLARAASVANGQAAVLFSLEMSRNEVTMRLLSAEARVPLHHMRTGQMGDEDWTRLARRMSEVVNAPLFIDDSPNMSMMEIRAKCRRLKQRHDLRLVIIDYLQLMTSPKRVENRQQEVSDMSRSLKLLAKELDVPVVAVAQLNRGPEQRGDKRPLLADLRESGCLTAATRILRADSGSEVSLGELVESGERDVPVWSLDEQLRLVPRIMTHAFPSGVREVFQVRLWSGREVQATASHPFLTHDGWRPLGELAAGSRVAVPRYVPAPLDIQGLPEHEIIMLADLVRRRQKFVPEAVFALPKRQLALFLRHLWATGGSVTVSKSGAARVRYATSSERLARDLQGLMLRFDIRPRVHFAGNTHGHPQWTVDIRGAEDQRRFLQEIGVHGDRAIAVTPALERLASMTAPGRLDTVPPGVWERVRRVMDGQAAATPAPRAGAGTGSRGDLSTLISPARKPLSRIAAVLGDAELEMLSTNDVYWDEIKSIQSIGMQPVYDATVLGTHNFLANGINLHNSIEQDADVVILLHREDAYERESPRAGEADFIVAKHRNGPTTTVTVAFQGHFSRFVDMAPG